MARPDETFYDAFEAARAGSRSVAEIADSVRQTQDEVEVLADKAASGQLPGLAGALQEYADTLGRARLSGADSLDTILDAREAVDEACISAAETEFGLTPTS